MPYLTSKYQKSINIGEFYNSIIKNRKIVLVKILKCGIIYDR